ncbi:MAG: trehalose/maltose transport system substrate-binding protein [Petroclostridium sp.]|jgi:multiple sugar transport system substrate-binding protein|nr:extracellular solute-binding protein family 1 [Clostridia bacterium]MDK2810512.1 trehalose/maltose transport system substrate-binding protein [Petroclostridium sp.]
MKNITRIKLLFIFLVVVLTFSIPGCISKYNNTDISGQSTEKKQDNSITVDKKTIIYSYGGNDHGGSMKRNIELFQKANPDIQVKLQQLPDSTDYQFNAYQVALSAGDSSFDVFNADIIWIAGLASANWILPLDRFFDEAKQQEFFANAIEACTYNGRIYAVPSRTDAPFLYYRSDIISQPPKTYEELMALVRKNKNFPGIKYGYIFQGVSYEGLVCNVLEFIWNNGGEVFENGKVVINTPESIEGLQLFIDIINSDVSSHDVLGFQEEDARIAFQDGTAIFMRNWPYAYKRLNGEDSKVKGKVGVAPLPVGPKGKMSRGTLGGWNYTINRHSKNPELVWKFIEWMSSYDAQVLDNTVGGYVPARKAVYHNEQVKKANPWVTDFTGIFESAKPRPVSPYYASISESMQVNFTNAILGKISARTAIENIEKDLKEILLRNSN